MFESLYEGLGLESSLLFGLFDSHTPVSSAPSPFLR